MFPRIHQTLYEHGSFTVPMQDTSCLDVDGLSVVIPSHGPPVHLIYLLLIFFSGALKAIVCETPVDSDIYPVVRIVIATVTINKKPDIFEMFCDPCGVDVIRISMTMGEISNTSCDSFNYYIVLFFRAIMCFTLLSVLCPYCVFMSLYHLKVAFTTTPSYVVMIPITIFSIYPPSMYLEFWGTCILDRD
ncbi:hypothetical protein AVEN_256432-1 [Araneus ventricosus]|uniref:Uncharacterized protein n=1 Tax=Araneus ventricosus TaxID=182803 RepID=A0A4Y2K2A4_ARAVE|nr:hypothetical protein AVEN_256432-1 [Araneus ventricosus]